jgi:excisionase family DNA binding protein
MEAPMHDERDGSPVAAAAGGSDGRLTWTIPEVAKLLGISKDSAYEAAHRGELPVQVIGRRVLVPRVALLRLLEGMREREPL